MQLDMHYDGTYAVARAAGIKPEFAQVIAAAAQCVDDSDTANVALRNGTFLASAASTAWHQPLTACCSDTPARPAARLLVHAPHFGGMTIASPLDNLADIPAQAFL
jgi:hypothetical protein